MTLMAVESGYAVYPLFIDYGQRSRNQELAACRRSFAEHRLPAPKVADLSGYGALISSGLTDLRKDIFLDAFLPGRNLMFLLLGAAYAYQVQANAVAIGLLDEKNSLFPDQTKGFVRSAEGLLSKVLSREVLVLTPLMSLTKADVVRLAKKRGLTHTYSCHLGQPEPCGICVACREYEGLEV
jgi:7-cyano-7-deazaguanine synthase